MFHYIRSRLNSVPFKNNFTIISWADLIFVRAIHAMDHIMDIVSRNVSDFSQIMIQIPMSGMLFRQIYGNYNSTLWCSKILAIMWPTVRVTAKYFHISLGRFQWRLMWIHVSKAKISSNLVFQILWQTAKLIFSGKSLKFQTKLLLIGLETSMNKLLGDVMGKVKSRQTIQKWSNWMLFTLLIKI